MNSADPQIRFNYAILDIEPLHVQYNISQQLIDFLFIFWLSKISRTSQTLH